ncbi:MAG: DUF2029 domain-containing protein [Anaerolineaceae bacterium]|nr:DUF2029 domain-containing protein [Anaerolineaceae bacterium]
MIRKLPWQQTLLVTILFIAFLILLTIGNYNFAVSQPGGTDFLFRWKPTQLVLLEGFNSPYDPEALQQVMILHYGENEGFDQKWPDIFLYPYYVMIIFAPFALIKEYLVARALWMTLIEVTHISILLLSFVILNYKPKKSTFFLLILFSLACSYFVQGLIDGNPAAIITLFIALSMYFASTQKDELAGVFLALSTMKPQLTLLFFILMWLWSFSNRRWKTITSSSITLGVLMGGSFLLLPSWFKEFLNGILLYSAITPPITPNTLIQVWFPAAAQWIAPIISLACILIIAWAWKSVWKKNFAHFFWAACLTFTILPLTGVVTAKSNFIAMLPAFILLIVTLSDNWENDTFLNLLIFIVLVLSWTFFTLSINLDNFHISFIDQVTTPVILVFFLIKYKAEMIARITQGSKEKGTI